MVSKLRTQSRFSLSVRMKRSAQPLPSGARTKAGELSMPRKAIARWKSWRAQCRAPPPMVVPAREAMGDALGEAAEAAAHALADRLQRLEAGGAEGRMDADAVGAAGVGGAEPRRPGAAG